MPQKQKTGLKTSPKQHIENIKKLLANKKEQPSLLPDTEESQLNISTTHPTNKIITQN